MKSFSEKYTIRDFIDKNKWSNVYEGINNETNEKIILNVLRNVGGKESNLEKFKKEIDLLKNMDCTNLVRIKGISIYTHKEKIYYYLESEHFEGLTLRELKECTELDEKQSLSIIREVIKGIREFNYNNLNYGDLTEDNIIINQEGVVKVSVLPFINRHEGHLNYKNLNNKNFDQYQDIYNIGKILYELITNKENFNSKKNLEDLDENLSEILIKSTNTKYISKHKYKNLNEFLDEVISYLNCGEIKHKKTYKKENNIYEKRNYNIKKYIVAIICFAVLTGGIYTGCKYILDIKNNNKVNTYASNNLQTKNNKKENKNNDVSPNNKKENDYIESNKISTLDNTDKNTPSITEKNQTSKSQEQFNKEQPKTEESKKQEYNNKDETNTEQNSNNIIKTENDNSNKDKNNEKENSNTKKPAKDEDTYKNTIDKDIQEENNDDNNNKEQEENNEEENNNEKEEIENNDEEQEEDKDTQEENNEEENEKENDDNEKDEIAEINEEDDTQDDNYSDDNFNENQDDYSLDDNFNDNNENNMNEINNINYDEEDIRG